MLLHLGLATSVNNYSVDPVGRFERGATQEELVVVQRVLVRRLTVLDLHGQESIKAVQVFIRLVAINMPIGCGGIGRGEDCVLHVSDCQLVFVVRLAIKAEGLNVSYSVWV